MDVLTDPATAVAFALWMFMLLVYAEADPSRIGPPVYMEDDDDVLRSLLQNEPGPSQNTERIMRSTAQNFQLCTALSVFDDEVTYWVKPRSTTWFSRFLLHEYDNSRWVSMFRMTKPAVFALAEVIRPHIQKKDTKYRLAVPMVVRVACTLFKLTHGANYTICSEMFAVGRSTVSKILREVVHAINDCLKHEISWPSGERLRDIQDKFSRMCSLPAVVGALDGVHIAIAKPKFCPADYYYFKSGGYSLNCQAVVDCDKRFLDLYVGMPGSTNDSRVLRRSTLHHLATQGSIMNPEMEVDGFSPYLLADSGYPLLPWIMTPHRRIAPMPVSETLLNRKLCKGRAVVENAFGILKQSFRELLGKIELHLHFLPNVIVCCAILHNILLRQSHEDVEQFLQVLQDEGMEEASPAPEFRPPVNRVTEDAEAQASAADIKRRQLGEYLVARRRPTL